MKTNKVIVETADYTDIITVQKIFDMPNEKWISGLQRYFEEEIIAVHDANTHHICKYCGGVAKGIDEDVLCEECRDVFGHAFYSEL